MKHRSTPEPFLKKGLYLLAAPLQTQCFQNPQRPSLCTLLLGQLKANGRDWQGTVWMLTWEVHTATQKTQTEEHTNQQQLQQDSIRGFGLCNRLNAPCGFVPSSWTKSITVSLCITPCHSYPLPSISNLHWYLYVQYYVYWSSELRILILIPRLSMFAYFTSNYCSVLDSLRMQLNVDMDMSDKVGSCRWLAISCIILYHLI